MSLMAGIVIIICSCLGAILTTQVLRHRERMAEINISKDKQK